MPDGNTVYEDWLETGSYAKAGRRHDISSYAAAAVVKKEAQSRQSIAQSLAEIALADPWRLYPKSELSPYNPSALVSKQGLSIFDQMRKDDQIKAALAFKKFSVLATGWEVSSPEGVEEDWEPALFLENQLRELEDTFENALLQVLSALDFGYSASEKVFARITEGQFSGRVGLTRIKTVKPHSIDMGVDKFGRLVNVLQTGPNGTASLPREKLVVYAYQKEFGNWYGRSDLEAAYRDWWTKKNVHRWMSMFLERFGIPPTFIMYDPTRFNPQQIEDLKTVVDRLQAATFGTIPRAGGAEALDFWTPEQTNQIAQTFIPAMDMYNKNIARALLMPGLLGVTPDDQQGSFARARVSFDAFMLVIEHIRQELETLVVNEQIVRPLIDMNYEVEEYPEWKLLPLTDDARLDLLKVWGELVGAGVVLPQADDERHIRSLLEFPDREGNDDEFKPPETGQPDPNMPDNMPEDMPADGQPPQDQANQQENFDAGQPRYPAGSAKGGQFAPKGGAGGGAAPGGGGADATAGGGGEFQSLDSAKSQRAFEDAHGPTEQLTKRESNAIAGYQNGDYIKVNKLNRGAPPPPLNKSDRQSAESVDRNMTGAFRKAPRLQEPVVLHRGMDAAIPTDADIGKVFADKGWVSTSVDRSTAKQFGQGGVAFELEVPRGVPILSVNGTIGRNRQFTKEKEVILPKGSAFKITSVNRKTRPPTVRARLVGFVPVETFSETTVVEEFAEDAVGKPESIKSRFDWTPETFKPVDETSLQDSVSFLDDSAPEYFRQKTGPEQRVDFAQITERLDGIEQGAKGQLVEIFKAERDRLAKLAEGERLELNTDTRLIRPRAKIAGVLGDVLQEALDAGRRDFRQEVRGVEMRDPSGVRPRLAERYLRSKTFWITGVVSDNLEAKVQSLLVAALRNGETGRQTAEKIRATFEPYIGDPKRIRDGSVIEPHRIENIIRTNTTDAYNQGRLVEMRDPDIKDFVQGVQYSAIIDSRTTEICRFLDGRAFKVDDPDLDSYTPPNHYMCRSVLVPIILEDEVQDSDFVTAQDKGKAADLISPDFGGAATKAR